MKTLVTPLIYLCVVFSLFAEGTKELRPTSAAGGLLNPWDWGGEFATYNAAPKDRLYFHIKDFQNEKAYMGFNAQYGGNTYLRIKDANDSVVYGPVLLGTFGNPGFIANYAEAVAGPVNFNSQGYTPFVFTPHMNGDYYIELNRDSPTSKTFPPVGVKGGYRYNHFDVTVANTLTNTPIKGRLWAYKWALTSGSGGIPFNAKMYVLRSDSIRFEVDYNGIDPYGFGIVSNSFGIDSTGDYLEDRKSNDSLYAQGTVPYQPRHKIFVNPPDPAAYPYATVEPAANLSVFGQDVITGCILTGYCFNLAVTKDGQVSVILDMDNTPGYQVGGRDRRLFGRVTQGANCIPWDGLDGFGDTARSANISIDMHYQAGLIHIPIYDAEHHPNGYIFSRYQGPTKKTVLPLYWDDSNFSNNINLVGCNTLPCRDYTNNYGNERFINTWSAAFEQRLQFSNMRFEFCPPVAVDDSAQVDEGKTVAILPLINDIAVLNEINPVSLTIMGGPSNGSVVFDTLTSTFRYAPNLGFKGVDIITYQVCDTFTPPRCDTAHIYITVNDANLSPDVKTVNGNPVANDSSAVLTVYEDSVLNICLNWIEYDGDSASISGVFRGPAHGSLAHIFDGDSCFTYTPNTNYNGGDTLIIEICDDQFPAGCDTLFIPINVLPVNDAPIILSANGVASINDTIATLSVNEDDSLIICLNVSDIEFDSGDVSLVLDPPASGSTANINSGDSCFVYYPNPDFFGNDTIRLIFCDTGVPTGCDTATIIINVLPVNDPPVALIDVSAVNPGDSVAKLVMKNDFDLESKNLTFTIVGGPKYGTAKVVGDSIRYVSSSLYPYGVDTVTYSVCDTGMPVLCAIGHYVIVFPKNNLPPVANNDTVSTFEDVPLTHHIGGNDFDPNYDPLTFSIVSSVKHGFITITNGTLAYVPFKDYNGYDTLVYEVCDTTAPTPLCDLATVYITVIPQQDDPVIDDGNGNPISRDSIIIFEDTPLKYCLHASDADNEPLNVGNAISLGGNGQITGLAGADTCFTFTPLLNYNGADSVRVVVCDNATPTGCDTLTLYITILPVNDAPVANNDSIHTGINTAVSVAVLSNDNDSVDASVLDTNSFQVLTNPLNGTVSYTNGTLVYTPANGFIGIDSLEYEICDVGVPVPPLCSTAWVYIIIDPKNDPPVAVNDTIGVFSNQLIGVEVLRNDFDPEGDSLTISIITPPIHGQASAGDTTVNYIANLSYCGPDSLEYRICDNRLPVRCSTAWVFIFVQPADSDQDSLSDSFETLIINTDGDAKNDYQDVDSDNDGIFDMTEASPIRNICSPTVMDFDGDGIPDFRDLDSDNDGIPDYVERSTVIVLPSGKDVDGDGIDDAYDSDFGGYLESNPIDTDGDGWPDFRDLDSDNDGRPDTEEKGENPDRPRDTDGDGVPDFRDVDSDGDGAPDNLETDGDCDRDGVPDWLDPDNCEVFVPQGISPDGDGVNDYLVIPQLFDYPENNLMIFNRWGNKVYAKKPYDNSWDGKASESAVVGQDQYLPAGTYYYILELGDGSKPLTGYIYLKR